MKIIIVGCGRVGSNLAVKLYNQGNDVSIIDRNPLAFDKIMNIFEGKMVIGTGIDEEVLINAGILDADLLISVTKGDNTNIMVGQIAKFLFHVKQVIIRIVDIRSKEFYEKEIGLTCYCPTEVSTNGYLDILKRGGLCT